MNVGMPMSMRKGLQVPRPITKIIIRKNYHLAMRRRPTGLIGRSGTLDNNI